MLPLLGLVAASAAVALYAAFLVEAARRGGFGNDFTAALAWIRPGLWTSLLALALSATGRGRSRVLSLAASALVLLVWIVPAWGM